MKWCFSLKDNHLLTLFHLDVIDLTLKVNLQPRPPGGNHWNQLVPLNPVQPLGESPSCHLLLPSRSPSSPFVSKKKSPAVIGRNGLRPLGRILAVKIAN